MRISECICFALFGVYSSFKLKGFSVDSFGMVLIEIFVLFLFVAVIVVELVIMIGITIYSVVSFLIRKFKKTEKKEDKDILKEFDDDRILCVKNIFMVFEKVKGKEGKLKEKFRSMKNQVEFGKMKKTGNELGKGCKKEADKKKRKRRNSNIEKRIIKIENPLEEKYRRKMRRKKSRMLLLDKEGELQITKQEMTYSKASKNQGKIRGDFGE